jgi:hypothetical protein
MLVLVCPDMLANLCDTLLDKIDLVFLGENKDLDTEAEGTIIQLLLAIIHIGYEELLCHKGILFFFDNISLYSKFWIGRQFSR